MKKSWSCHRGRQSVPKETVPPHRKVTRDVNGSTQRYGEFKPNPSGIGGLTPEGFFDDRNIGSLELKYLGHMTGLEGGKKVEGTEDLVRLVLFARPASAKGAPRIPSERAGEYGQAT